VEPPVQGTDRLLAVCGAALARMPDALIQLAAGPPRFNRRGVRLDPRVQLLMRANEATRLGVRDAPVEVARQNIRRSVGLVSRPVPPPITVSPDTIAGRPARVYRPPGGPKPVLVYFHGGGFVIGDLDTIHRSCARIAHEVDAVVVSIDYRLAPEHPWPAGVEDAEAAFRDTWDRTAALGGIPGRVGVGGDSAGGNLAAVTSLRLRDSGGPLPTFQQLVYPATDQRKQTASLVEFAEGLLLTRASVDWFQAHYAPDVLHPHASPLLAEDLSGLPPAVVATAGFDPLRDEGERYAAALREAGVEVEHIDAEDQVHGFLSMDRASPGADRAFARLNAATKRLAWR
jgi:acetyl esterase